MPEERKTDTPKRRTTENSNDHEHDSSNLLHPYYFGILFLNRLTKTAMPEERKTDTPETDAAEDQQEEASEYRGHLVRADFARKLERERDEARKAVSHIEAGAIAKADELMSISRFAGEMEIFILRKPDWGNTHECQFVPTGNWSDKGVGAEGLCRCGKTTNLPC